MGADDDSLKERRRVARRSCRSTLFGHGELKPREALARLVDEAGDEPDVYGEGGVLAELESEVADVLGKPAAVFMPSGILAQQCALRVWADRRASRRVAVHGLSHLVVHELDALETVHGLTLDQLTAERRPLLASDVAELPGHLAAVSVELPLRDGGHRLPSSDELTALVEACRDRGVPLHLDGARLWESTPYWQRTPAEVAALADSVYVSFYKGLGALAGAALAGEADLIAEARRWQRRCGGNLVSLLPYAVSALQGLRQHLPRMSDYHDAAVAVAAAMVTEGFRIDPDPPHTNAFRVFAPHPAEQVNERLLTHLESSHEALTAWFRPAQLPGWSMTEFTVGAATCEHSPDQVARRAAAAALTD